MQRLKTQAQFEAVLAGGAVVSRTEHFILHRLALPVPDAGAPAPGPGDRPRVPLFALQEPYVGAVVPKRWARRAVTRNAIKRQIYTVSQDYEDRLPIAAHVVRLRAAFDKARFPSATSAALKVAVRAELQQLLAGARR